VVTAANRAVHPGIAVITTVRRPTLAVVPIALLLLVPLLIAAAEPVSLRPDRVRAFVVQDAATVLVREGRDTARRVVLDGACQSLAGAERIAFQIGAVLPSTQQTGRDVPVALKNAPPVVSTATPHLHLVAAQGDRRAACRVARIEAATDVEFAAAEGLGDVRDQRRDAAGR